MIQFLLSWGPAVLWAGILFLLSAQSSLPKGPDIPFGDKIAHFLLYAVLGLALAWGGRRSSRRAAVFTLILVGILFAASDERHQAWVPRRQPSMGDFFADAAGIVLGYIVASALIKALRQPRTTRL